jgi:hypothetical protein
LTSFYFKSTTVDSGLKTQDFSNMHFLSNLSVKFALVKSGK